jgi:hypothetical protein
LHKPTGRKAAGESRWTQHLVAVRPTPYGVGLVRQLHKPTGRKAAGESRWTQQLVAVRPTPYGVGLVRQLHKPTGRKAAGVPHAGARVQAPTDRVWNAVACIGHAAWRHAVGG